MKRIWEESSIVGKGILISAGVIAFVGLMNVLVAKDGGQTALGLMLLVLAAGIVGWVVRTVTKARGKSLRTRKMTTLGVRQAIPTDVKRAVWERDGGRCVFCDSDQDLEFDHDVPFSKGGSNSANNIQLLCRTCNRKKSAKIM
jgi:5-methylcytosine-specific restriction endonuclease McrA